MIRLQYVGLLTGGAFCEPSSEKPLPGRLGSLGTERSKVWDNGEFDPTGAKFRCSLWLDEERDEIVIIAKDTGDEVRFRAAAAWWRVMPQSMQEPPAPPEEVHAPLRARLARAVEVAEQDDPAPPAPEPTALARARAKVADPAPTSPETPAARARPTTRRSRRTAGEDLDDAEA